MDGINPRRSITMNNIETADRGDDSGLRSLAIHAGMEFEDVLRLAERRQLHLAIAKANTPEGKARGRAHARLLEQRDGITQLAIPYEHTTKTGRQALAATMAMRWPAD
jgi:hypothetical protein